MLLITMGLLQATTGGLLLLVCGNLPYTIAWFASGSAVPDGGVWIVPHYFWIAAPSWG